MRYCETCGISISGTIEYCPLCQSKLSGEAQEDAYPVLPEAPRTHRPVHRPDHNHRSGRLYGNQSQSARKPTVVCFCDGRSGKRLAVRGNDHTQTAQSHESSSLAVGTRICACSPVGLVYRMQRLVHSFCAACFLFLYAVRRLHNGMGITTVSIGLYALPAAVHSGRLYPSHIAALRRPADYLPFLHLWRHQRYFPGRTAAVQGSRTPP